MGFLDALGEGLRGAGAIMSPDVYDQQAKERAALQQHMLEQRRLQQQMYQQAVENGAISPENVPQGIGLPKGLGPSQTTLANQEMLREKQRLDTTNQQAGQFFQQQVVSGKSRLDALKESLSQFPQSTVLHQMAQNEKTLGEVSDKGTWSEPYVLQGAQVQKNTKTGEIRTAVSRVPASIINIGKPQTKLTAMDKAVANTVDTTMNEAGLSIKNLSELTNNGKIHISTGTYNNLSDKGMLGATAKQMTQSLTTQDKQMYQSILLPLARQAATMQNPRYRINEQSVNQSMATIISSAGQTHMTMLEKMAEAKQTILKGAEAALDAGNLNERQTATVEKNIESIKKSIPWDVSDVIEFYRSGGKAENFGDWLSKKQGGQTSAMSLDDYLKSKGH